jgi:hypothetical protein
MVYETLMRAISELEEAILFEGLIRIILEAYGVGK